MSYSSKELRREIKNIVVGRLERGDSIIRAWLVREVLVQHPLPEMEDVDFNELCRNIAVVQEVRHVLRELKLSSEKEEGVSGAGELPLPGYKHLQRGYPIERDGEIVIVPIFAMSRQEIEERAEKYMAMAKGCEAHAEELRLFSGRMPDSTDDRQGSLL